MRHPHTRSRRQGPMPPAALRRQRWVKIGPMRVFAFDQIDFPVALPLLDLPFPDERCLKAFMAFEPHETVHAVFGGKAGDGACFVLPNAAREFEARTDVQRAVGLAGEEINKRPRADRYMGPCLRRDPVKRKTWAFRRGGIISASL